jgi:hypothetical protein
MALNIGAANREAVERLCRARPAWTKVATAREALGLTGQALLHAGPPITWARMCGPMRGAVTAAILFEGWAKSPTRRSDSPARVTSRLARVTTAAPSAPWPASSHQARRCS